MRKMLIFVGILTLVGCSKAPKDEADDLCGHILNVAAREANYHTRMGVGDAYSICIGQMRPIYDYAEHTNNAIEKEELRKYTNCMMRANSTADFNRCGEDGLSMVRARIGH